MYSKYDVLRLMMIWRIPRPPHLPPSAPSASLRLLLLRYVVWPPLAQPLVPRPRKCALAPLQELTLAIRHCEQDGVVAVVVDDLSAEDRHARPVLELEALVRGVVAGRVKLRAAR